MTTIRLRYLPQPTMIAKVSPRVSSQVAAGDGIEVDYDGGIYTVTASRIFALCIPISGRPNDGEEIEAFLFVDAVTFPAGFTGSLAKAAVAANAETVFGILVDGVEVGTVTFAAAATTGTFTLTDELTCATGQQLDLQCPAIADTTLADIKITLRGN
jgi:hypothetical protein